MQIDYGIFYSSLATIVLIIAVGYFISKMKWFNESANKAIVTILLNIGLPCALFYSFPGEFSQQHLTNFLWGVGGGILVFLAAVVVSKILFPRKRNPKNYYESQFAYIFNNASFLGFPLVSAIFGQDGLVPYSGFIIIFSITLFGYGAPLVSGRLHIKDILKAFINPNVIAVILGFLVFLFSLQLPKFASDTIHYVGSITTPMSLICIGFMLSRAKIRQVFRKFNVVFVCAAQLLIGPMLTFAVLKLIGAPHSVISILVLIQALPTATTLALFAEKYRDDTGNASEIVAVSTVLSAVSLPIIIMVMNVINK
ncbi:MAG: AEC family transporter [Candidatus Nomurabacteria bacterium]|jgi:predicted permease|nr:AEC family transporter [Candidatus Nomurabacteria bacterium]